MGYSIESTLSLQKILMMTKKEREDYNSQRERDLIENKLNELVVYFNTDINIVSSVIEEMKLKK